MIKYVIKFKKRGVFSFNEYDIAVFKNTSAPSQSPLVNIGKYKANLTEHYESLALDLQLLNYWLSKGACLHPSVKKLLELYYY